MRSNSFLWPTYIFVIPGAVRWTTWCVRSSTTRSTGTQCEITRTRSPPVTCCPCQTSRGATRASCDTESRVRPVESKGQAQVESLPQSPVVTKDKVLTYETPTSRDLLVMWVTNMFSIYKLQLLDGYNTKLASHMRARHCTRPPPLPLTTACSTAFHSQFVLFIINVTSIWFKGHLNETVCVKSTHSDPP